MGRCHIGLLMGREARARLCKGTWQAVVGQISRERWYHGPRSFVAGVRQVGGL